MIKLTGKKSAPAPNDQSPTMGKVTAVGFAAPIRLDKAGS